MITCLFGCKYVCLNAVLIVPCTVNESTREDESSVKRHLFPPYSAYLMFQTASISEQEYSEDIGSNASF